MSFAFSTILSPLCHCPPLRKFYLTEHMGLTVFHYITIFRYEYLLCLRFCLYTGETMTNWNNKATIIIPSSLAFLAERFNILSLTQTSRCLRQFTYINHSIIYPSPYFDWILSNKVVVTSASYPLVTKGACDARITPIG